jgi:hypothetical protein
VAINNLFGTALSVRTLAAWATLRSRSSRCTARFERGAKDHVEFEDGVGREPGGVPTAAGREILADRSATRQRGIRAVSVDAPGDRFRLRFGRCRRGDTVCWHSLPVSGSRPS